MPPDAPDALARRLAALEDRAAVVDLVSAVYLLTDRREWARVRACYADEVLLDYASLTGQPPAAVRADDLVAGWQTVLPGFEATQHLVTNHQVTVDGDAATCVAHVHATHYLPSRTGDGLWTTAGHCTMGLVRTAAGWKVARHAYTATWGRGNQALLAAAAARVAAEGAGGRRPQPRSSGPAS